MISEKEAAIRLTLSRLDAALLTPSSDQAALSTRDIALLRRQLDDNGTMAQEATLRTKALQEENDMLTKRKDEVELRLRRVETEYEELLGMGLSAGMLTVGLELTAIEFIRHFPDKIIQEDERADTTMSANVQDIKVRRLQSVVLDHAGVLILFCFRLKSLFCQQTKLEMQYAVKLDSALGDIMDLQQQVELKLQENKSVTASLESLRDANMELGVCFRSLPVTS